jgi:hypothetical protein
MTGEMKASFRKETKSDTAWTFLLTDTHFFIAISSDHEEISSLKKIANDGTSTDVEEGAIFWYVPQARIENPIIVNTESYKTSFGSFSCRIAEHTDTEGNHFRWYLVDEIPGGVLRFDASFAGEPKRILHFEMQGFGSDTPIKKKEP